PPAAAPGPAPARVDRVPHAAAHRRHIRARPCRLALLPRDEPADAPPRPDADAVDEHAARSPDRRGAAAAPRPLRAAAGRPGPVGGVVPGTARPVRGLGGVAGPARPPGRRPAAGSAARRDPGLPQPGVAGLYLFPVLSAPSARGRSAGARSLRSRGGRG